MFFKVIYNPAAGRGRARSHIREVEQNLRALGAEFDVQGSGSPAELTRLAAEASRSDCDRVLICGGDGSLNLALRDFDLQRGTLALVPLGSGDDFARVNGIPRNVRAACELAVRGNPREVDIALVNDLRYSGVAGVGFDSEVARYANGVKVLRGSAVYLFAILRILPSFRPHRVRINGRDENVMFVVFGNSPQYGSGIRIVPDADLHDGLLDSCIVHETSRLQLLLTLPLAYKGTHVRKPFVEIRRGAEFFVETPEPLDVFADGEPLSTTPARFRIAAERLRIVAP